MHSILISFQVKISFSLLSIQACGNLCQCLFAQGIFNDLDKVDNLNPFFWLAIIMLIIFLMASYLIYFDNKL